MNAYLLDIDAKVKLAPFGIVSPDDFQYREGGAVDARAVIEQPNISLYCLDHQHQRAIFVETPAGFDLLDAPFYFQAQYEAAQQLIAVPYDALHGLAREARIDPARIVLVYSTGRCGSTLISRVFEQTAGVVSFSEPDVFTQLVILRAAGHSDDITTSRLLHDCLQLMCANTRHGGAQSWAFKFRSYVTNLADLLYQAVPEAKLIFLYRNAEAWAKSFSRAFAPSNDEELATLVQQTHRWLLPLVGAYAATHTAPIAYPDFLARFWLASMQDCLKLQRQGAPMFCARYEDLKVAPREVIAALFAHCGLKLPEPALLDRILAQDSQAGTPGAQAATQAARLLTARELAELDRLIRSYDPALAPDTIIPQTFRP
jgi:hypothetical protein